MPKKKRRDAIQQVALQNRRYGYGGSPRSCGATAWP
jgi:hypothetical protein